MSLSLVYVFLLVWTCPYPLSLSLLYVLFDLSFVFSIVPVLVSYDLSPVLILIVSNDRTLIIISIFVRPSFRDEERKYGVKIQRGKQETRDILGNARLSPLHSQIIIRGKKETMTWHGFLDFSWSSMNRSNIWTFRIVPSFLWILICVSYDRTLIIMSIFVRTSFIKEGIIILQQQIIIRKKE